MIDSLPARLKTGAAPLESPALRAKLARGSGTSTRDVETLSRFLQALAKAQRGAGKLKKKSARTVAATPALRNLPALGALANAPGLGALKNLPNLDTLGSGGLEAVMGQLLRNFDGAQLFAP